jgi:nucleoside-diphosphate-sugar epimerase
VSILVTGATGDVGRRVVRNLVGRGEHPIAFDIAPRTQGIEDLAGKYKLVKGDILKLGELIDAIKGNEVKNVIHVASMLTNDAEARPLYSLEVNTMGTANVMEAARLTGVKRVIYTSTSSVYGESAGNEVIDEEHQKEPRNIYGVSKFAGDYYSRHYAKKYGIEYAACRLRIVLGAGQRTDTGMMHLLKMQSVLSKLSKGEEVVIPYAPDEEQAVTHPSDAAKGLALALFAPTLPHTAYNIMSGAFKFSEIAKAFELAWPSARVTAREPGGGAPKAARAFGKYSIERARKELGYEPEYDIYRIIREVVEYERKRMGST